MADLTTLLTELAALDLERTLTPLWVKMTAATTPFDLAKTIEANFAGELLKHIYANAKLYRYYVQETLDSSDLPLIRRSVIEYLVEEIRDSQKKGYPVIADPELTQTIALWST